MKLPIGYKNILKDLNSLRACDEAVDWFQENEFETWEEIWHSCHRGDWLLWIFYKKIGDCKELVFAKAECASLSKHLMKDERSLEALEACYEYCEGLIGDEELRAAAAAAYAAAYAAHAAAYAAHAAGYAAAYAAHAAGYAAHEAGYAAAYAAHAAGYAAHEATLKKCADICRTYLTDAFFNKFRF